MPTPWRILIIKAGPDDGPYLPPQEQLRQWAETQNITQIIGLCPLYSKDSMRGEAAPHIVVLGRAPSD